MCAFLQTGVFKTTSKMTYEYTAFQILGQGSFGMVYLARTSSNNSHSSNSKNELVAVKCKLVLSDYELMQKSNVLFRGELEALFNLNHPNIVRLLGVELELGGCGSEVSSLVMEHIPGEPLDKHIYKNRKLTEDTIQLITRQTVDDIEFMHSKLVMHRQGESHLKKYIWQVSETKGPKKRTLHVFRWERNTYEYVFNIVITYIDNIILLILL